MRKRVNLKLERIEFHTEFKPQIQDFSGECKRQLPQKIPAGISLRIVRWKERNQGDGLHNRYILTDRGGIRMAWGLDEGHPGQTDDISLLKPSIYKERWKQYCEEPTAFEFVDECHIQG